MRRPFHHFQHAALLAALVPACFLALPAARLLAHDVFPTAIQMRPNTFSQITVTDLTGCAAAITATSTDTSVVKVYAADMVAADGSLLPGNGTTVTVPNRVSQIFLVVATPVAFTPKAAVVNICWVGTDFNTGSGPCQENNCSPFVPHGVSITVNPFAKNSATNPFCGVYGDPVTTLVGEQTLTEEHDLRWKGPMSLLMRRHYSSRSVAEGFTSGRLGPNWRHDYEWSLRDAGGGKEIVAPDGRLLRFDKAPFDAAYTLTSGTEQPFELIDGAVGTFKLRDGRDGQILTFDSTGVLTKVEDGRGNALMLAYTSGRLATVSDGLGRSLAFTYNGGGQLVQVGDGTRSVAYGYDGSSRLVSFTDAMANVTSYAYDAAQPAQALLVAKTRPEGNVPWTQVYDTGGRVVTQSDAFARQFALSFDDANSRTTTSDPLMATQVHTHAGGNNLTALQFENSKSATLTYDTVGHPTALTDRLGARTTWAWDLNANRIQTRTDPDGATTRLTWTPRAQLGFTFHDLTRVIFPDSTTEDFAYDASGNVTSRTDASGSAWARTYGLRGERLSATDPDGTTWTYTWGADFTCESATDPEGNKTDYLYDAYDRLVAVLLPDSSVLSATWDDCDRLTSITDEEGDETDFAWDDNGNLIGVMLPDGAIWSYDYDTMDRLIGVTDPDGFPATFTLDAYGRVASATNAAGETIDVTWSFAGNVSSVTDENGTHTTFGFDDEEVPNSVIDPGGGNWSFITDATGHLTRATSPAGRSVVTTRDLLSRPIARFDGLGNRTDFGYDGYGRIDRIAVPALGTTTNLDRDGRGRLDGVMRGAAEWLIGRDATGAADQYIDPLGRTTTSTLDQRSRPIHADFPLGLGSVDLTWSAGGKLDRALFSDLLDVQYTYDDMRRPLTTNGVTLVRDTKGAVVDSNGIGMTRDERSRITSMTFGVGHSVNYTYDAGGRLTGVLDWLGGQTTIGYDAAGREDALAFPNGVNETRAYDADSRVIRITATAPGALTLVDLQFTRDADGRITTASRTQPVIGEPVVGTASHTYDLAGQDTSFTYNALGLRISDATRTYSYNLASQLVGASDGVENFAYENNGFGDVDSIQSTTVSGTFTWNYGTTRPSIAKVQQDAVDAVCYVSRPDGRLLYGIDVDDDSRTYFHYDEAGNTLVTTDDAAAIVNAYAWSHTGGLLARTGPAAEYPFAEFTVGAQDFRVALGVGFALRDRVWDSTTGSMLQPTRNAESLADPATTPYVLGQIYRSVTIDLRDVEPRFFPQIPGGSGDSTNAPTFQGVAGLPKPSSPHEGLNWIKCSDCHPDGLTDEGARWTFPTAPSRSFPLDGGFGGATGRLGGGTPLTPAAQAQLLSFLDSTSLAPRFQINTGPPVLDDEERRSLRRAVLKLQVEEKLNQIYFSLGGYAVFVSTDGANQIADHFGDLFQQLEQAGMTDARGQFIDYLLDDD